MGKSKILIKLSNKYEHLKFMENIQNVVKSCGRFNYENKKKNLNIYIEKKISL